jgi:hypothetical protein
VATAVTLRRRHPGGVGVGNANTWHQRLALDLKKLLDCSSSIRAAARQTELGSG